jgi:polysaccharide export outer membrane protein
MAESRASSRREPSRDRIRSHIKGEKMSLSPRYLLAAALLGLAPLLAFAQAAPRPPTGAPITSAPRGAAPAAPLPGGPAASPNVGAPTAPDYPLAAGDALRVTVFQNPDLTLETRVAENGTITYPLIGTVQVGGTTVAQAEKKIAQMLKDGGFIVAPQVTILLTTAHGNQINVLGQVAKPGRYQLDNADAKISDVLALAGGVNPTGADFVTFTGTRDGRTINRDIDVSQLAQGGDPAGDLKLRPGDTLFVPLAPKFYIYGEVNRPGQYKLERDMNVMQALATGGGITPKGTLRGMKINRKGPDGKLSPVSPKLEDPLHPDDVIYIKESLF